jgi:hypothetical protein
MAQFGDKFPVQASKVPISAEVRNIINQELFSKGLSELTDILSFKRNNVGINIDGCHVDDGYKSICNVSIVIPVSGYENTGQYWFDGDYKIVKAITPANVTYNALEWNTPGILIGVVNITSPMLCRVNIPHGAYGNGLEYRVTATIRFRNNETFEEVYEKLSK